MVDPKTYMSLVPFPDVPDTKIFTYKLDYAINKDIVDFYVDTTNQVLSDLNVMTPNLIFIEGMSNLPLAIMDQSKVNHLIRVNEKSNKHVLWNKAIIPVDIPPMPNNPTVVLLDSLIYDNTYWSILRLLKDKITKPIYYVTHNTNLSYTNIKTMLEVSLKEIL